MLAAVLDIFVCVSIVGFLSPISSLVGVGVVDETYFTS